MIIKNISQLVGIVPEGVLRKEGLEQGETGVLENAWLEIEDGRITDFGTMDKCPEGESIDAAGGMLMPGFCDSHTHIVWAGSREGEFLDKINGLSYEEIARRGGGILNSADLLHQRSEEELLEESLPRVREMMDGGTVAMEIKSGYGLNREDELKMLRVIRRIREKVPAAVVSTFLGAHAVPRGRSREDWVDVILDMIPDAAVLAAGAEGSGPAGTDPRGAGQPGAG